MSMIAHYRRLTMQQLAALQNAPESIAGFLYADDASGDSEEQSLDIDKSWHAIHFLLNGEAWEGDQPFFDVVLGGMPLGDVEIGYGPVRFLTPSEVQSVASVLTTITANDLRTRFDLDALAAAEIYPNVWEDETEELDYLLPYYERLVRFFQAAAQRGEAMLLYIN